MHVYLFYTSHCNPKIVYSHCCSHCPSFGHWEPAQGDTVRLSDVSQSFPFQRCPLSGTVGWQSVVLYFVCSSCGIRRFGSELSFPSWRIVFRSRYQGSGRAHAIGMSLLVAFPSAQSWDIHVCILTPVGTLAQLFLICASSSVLGERY